MLCGSGWTAGVDVRGGGPGGRETDALSPENLVGRAHALVLSGGSVFGLAAADGVAAVLSSRGIGLQLRKEGIAIPIVPAAVLHDLANGGDKSWGLSPPYRELGMRALAAADAEFALGSVGAGRGAMAGSLKGGIGSSSVDLGEGLIVGALVALNSVGSPMMPDGKTYWAWAFELGRRIWRRGAAKKHHGLERSSAGRFAACLGAAALAARRQHHAGSGRLQCRFEHGGVQALGHDGAGRYCARRTSRTHPVRRGHNIRRGERRIGARQGSAARGGNRANRIRCSRLPGARHRPCGALQLKPWPRSLRQWVSLRTQAGRQWLCSANPQRGCKCWLDRGSN